VPERRGTLLLLGGLAGSAVVVLVLVLLLGRGAPVTHPGLPSAPGAVLWLLAAAPLAHLVLGTATVSGGLLLGGYLTRPVGSPRTVTMLATTWAVTLVATFVLLGVEQHALGVPVSQFPSSPQATGVFMAVLVVGFTAYVAPSAPRAVVPLALLGLLPPLLTGHVRTAPAPWVTGTALVVHVATAATWVAGLAAVGVLVLRGRPWADALRRFSPVALVCAATVAASGVLVALSRIGEPGDLVRSGYGAVVLAKAAALVLLVVAGYLQRRLVLGAARPSRPMFLLVGGAEITVMALTFALAAGLSQTPPP
jgi:putative copper resistance protein D